jgi:hypothetical protein
MRSSKRRRLTCGEADRLAFIAIAHPRKGVTYAIFISIVDLKIKLHNQSSFRRLNRINCFGAITGTGLIVRVSAHHIHDDHDDAIILLWLLSLSLFTPTQSKQTYSIQNLHRRFPDASSQSAGVHSMLLKAIDYSAR